MDGLAVDEFFEEEAGEAIGVVTQDAAFLPGRAVQQRMPCDGG